MADPKRKRRVTDEALQLGHVLIRTTKLKCTDLNMASLLDELDLFLRIEEWQRAHDRFVAAYYAHHRKDRPYRGGEIWREAKALFRADHPHP